MGLLSRPARSRQAQAGSEPQPEEGTVWLGRQPDEPDPEPEPEPESKAPRGKSK